MDDDPAAVDHGPGAGLFFPGLLPKLALPMKDLVVEPPPRRYLRLSPRAAAILVIALTSVLRLFYAHWLPLLPDEAYYFQWSRHLDASYFSKGPAVAYTIAAGTGLFGPNNIGVRFFAVALSAGTAWQVFLLARRWYDEVSGLVAVLVLNVVPIYAVGAVVMTIDPLSAFFWVWAANWFSRAVQKDRLATWLFAGFAVGCGFLAKYVNALELLSFAAFLALVPSRRVLLVRPGFWLMVLVAFACASPVFWWNAQHGWVSAGQLADRGQLHTAGHFALQFSTFLDFILMQAIVISPWLFLALAVTLLVIIRRRFVRASGRLNEGELLLFLLFVPVWVFYLALSFHLRGEPNWPAVAYLSLIAILSAHWRKMMTSGASGQAFIVFTFIFAWVQTLLMYNTSFLPLSQKHDPMGRVIGWREIGAHLYDLRVSQHADVLIADAYKEASILSFETPNQPFIYTLRHSPPANQFDLWPSYPTAAPHRALWITGEPSPATLRHDFNTITWLETDMVYFHGKPFRTYDVYLCENKAP